jgi:nucleoside-diphosphate-sugar epimerase
LRIAVIGGFGKVGSALVNGLQGHELTITGRNKGHHYDLRHPSILPPCDVSYIVACSINESVYGPEDMWLANVDGTIQTIKNLENQGAFVVFLSSQAIYARNDNYATHKKLVEMFVQGRSGAIVRLGTVTDDNLPDLVQCLKSVGERKTYGVTLWGKI